MVVLVIILGYLKQRNSNFSFFPVHPICHSTFFYLLDVVLEQVVTSIIFISKVLSYPDKFRVPLLRVTIR
jgi:hypothetical protein